MLAEISQDPITYKEAISRVDSEMWVQAINEELDSMKKNNVWEYVDRPSHKVIDSRWIFKKKLDKMGKDKYKARLVIRGFKDANNYDLRDTYAPVSRLPTVRVVLAIINKMVWCPH